MRRPHDAFVVIAEIARGIAGFSGARFNNVNDASLGAAYLNLNVWA